MHLSPKNVKQDLLCYFEYSLSYKNDFGTKNIFLFSNKKWIYYCLWNIYNSFSRSSKIMRLVLLAFFEHVLPRKYLCDHIFYISHSSPTLGIFHFLHSEYMTLIRCTPKHPRDTITQSHTHAKLPPHTLSHSSSPSLSLSTTPRARRNKGGGRSGGDQQQGDDQYDQ